MSELKECLPEVNNHEDRTPTPTINIEASQGDTVFTVDISAAKLRSNSETQFNELSTGYRDNNSESEPRSWGDSMSDISQCSSSNRPVSLCVKYAESEDNLLAIESDLEALEDETSYDKLQRQFDNSKLSDIFDYEQEQRRRSMSAIPTKKPRPIFLKGNESPAQSRVT
ncbi:uncharacterized protein LOC134820426 isoform X3 [Bolinopsis microptera]|uniref:uncharacterized protein LOC134820426 isoform X3 n=1 Tax=Bolinopsis microptera TaxID=2820187 RepID=UPI0030799806